MRTYTTAVQSALSLDYVIMAALVTMQFDSGTLRVTNCPYTLTVSAQTYVGLGALGEITGINETSDLSAEQVKLSLSGANSAIIAAALTENPQNRPITIQAAIFTGSYTLIADPTTIWDGTMDNFEINDYGGQNAQVILNAVHFLADRDRPRLGRFNDADHRAIASHSGDLGFEYVETMTDITLRWGRS